MNALARFIVKYKYVLLAVFIILTALSVVGIMYVNVNSDIISYLPDDMVTAKGFTFLRENFDMEGDAIVGIDNVTYEEVESYVERINQMKGIRDGGVIWYGTFDSFADIGISFPGVDINDVVEQIKSNPNVLKMFVPKENCYLIMLQMNVPTTSPEATNIITGIDAMLAADGREFSVGGMTAITAYLFDSTIGEIGMYMIIGVLIVLLVLMVSTRSFVEPLILIITLGISIILNFGSNIIFPEVSVITFAATAILQMALSMDYAIFLLHAFTDERKMCLDDKTAMCRALPRTMSTVLASSLTTVGGFLALFFMQFELGADMGVVLAKGVALSLLTVIFLQPCLMLLCSKAVENTSHKLLHPKFIRTAGFSIRHRKALLVGALLLLIPAIIGQVNVEYSYMKMQKEPENPTEIQKIVDMMGTTIILCVPADSPDKQLEYVHELSKIESVEAVNGIYTIIPEEYAKLVPLLVRLAPDMAKNYINNGYTMYSVLANVDSESKEAGVLLRQLNDTTSDLFGDKYYITGMPQAVSDLAEITPKDFTVVTLVSVLIILVVLLLTLRSAKYSAALIGVVELGILINIAISYFMKQPINFMAYIIISSIQLGATIDYAILYTVKFQRNSQTMSVKEASFKALKESGVSILTSATVIAAVCISVFLMASNQIVGEITLMIGRGAIISCLLVLFVLPALLITITGNVKENPLSKYIRKREKKRLKL